MGYRSDAGRERRAQEQAEKKIKREHIAGEKKNGGGYTVPPESENEVSERSRR